MQTPVGLTLLLREFLPTQSNPLTSEPFHVDAYQTLMPQELPLCLPHRPNASSLCNESSLEAGLLSCNKLAGKNAFDRSCCNAF